MNRDIHSLSNYDFELPDELIAQQPPAERRESRLMIVDRQHGRIEHHSFPDIAAFLQAGDRLVLNTTKVIPARVYGHRVATKGRLEVLFVESRGAGLWEVLIRARGRLEVGEKIAIDNLTSVIELSEKKDRGAWIVRLDIDDEALFAFLDEHGEMPLPPYIKREKNSPTARALDRKRYQTVFAETPGAVAAPTAGLHFDDQLLTQLADQGITRSNLLLRVGLGTFQPISIDDYRQHPMHSEQFALDSATAQSLNETRHAGHRVVAVGTTSLRCLESCWDSESESLQGKSGDTDIFIYPPRKVNSVDCLLTNFHLPKSSLMLLVAAFAGRDFIMEAYAKAVEQRYRFFSYGDAMLIL